jgi:hypothetical protein
VVAIDARHALHDLGAIVRGYDPAAMEAAKGRIPTTCATRHAASCILSLGLNAEIVFWIVSVLQSGGDMQGVENISTLEKVLTHRRTALRFPTEREWDNAQLAARVLFRMWGKETGGGK